MIELQIIGLIIMFFFMILGPIKYITIPPSPEFYWCFVVAFTGMCLFLLGLYV
jgi:hypothetical protein